MEISIYKWGFKVGICGLIVGLIVLDEVESFFWEEVRKSKLG